VRPHRCRSLRPAAVHGSLPVELSLDHLATGTALGELTRLAGIDEVGSLLRYARHVPGAPQSKAALRERLATESR
jgi:hypothetical protein